MKLRKRDLAAALPIENISFSLILEMRKNTSQLSQLQVGEEILNRMYIFFCLDFYPYIQ